MNINWIEITAIVLSPILAVLASIYIQNRGEKRKLKEQTFLKLFVNRSLFIAPFPKEYVEALNSIDVVFHSNTSVVQLWHSYFDLLSQPTPNNALLNTARLNLMFEMGKILGYKNLKQTDIERVYHPQGDIDLQLKQNYIADLTIEALKAKIPKDPTIIGMNA